MLHAPPNTGFLSAYPVSGLPFFGRGAGAFRACASKFIAIANRKTSSATVLARLTAAVTYLHQPCIAPPAPVRSLCLLQSYEFIARALSPAGIWFESKHTGPLFREKCSGAGRAAPHFSAEISARPKSDTSITEKFCRISNRRSFAPEEGERTQSTPSAARKSIIT